MSGSITSPGQSWLDAATAGMMHGIMGYGSAPWDRQEYRKPGPSKEKRQRRKAQKQARRLNRRHGRCR